MTMDNFFNYITKNLNPEDVDTWFRANNIISEKMELYYDFSYSLYLLIKSTYLGSKNEKNETLVKMTDEDDINHFDWCWKKTVDNFKKESIIFKMDGDHYKYFFTLFDEIFYKQEKEQIRESIDVFFNDLFNKDKPFTQVDLDLIYNIYKSLDNNLII
jgi:hypothetical protein